MVAGDAQYIKDQAGWDAMATGPEITAAVEATLVALQAAATSFSPRSTEAERAYFAQRYGSTSTVRYADAFSHSTEVQSRQGRPRVEGELRNDAPHAAAVEVGNVRVRRPHHPMARAAASLGSAQA